jgi:hypothetical protein
VVVVYSLNWSGAHSSDILLSHRYWQQFKNFVVSIGKAQSANEVEQLFPNLPSEYPEWISLWIMEK